MPIILQKYLNDSTELAVWKITESIEELQTRLHLFAKEDFKLKHRYLHWMASRVLLQELLRNKTDSVLLHLNKQPNGKPYIDGLGWHISISHSGNYAAAIVSKTESVGVDIEEITERIKKIAPKFINDYEWSHLKGENDLETMYLIWSAKEAIFKWFGSGEVDFRKHIQLFFPVKEEGTKIDAVLLKEKEYNLTVHTEKIDDSYCLCWVL